MHMPWKVWAGACILLSLSLDLGFVAATRPSEGATWQVAGRTLEQGPPLSVNSTSIHLTANRPLF